jgi:hypothetical protein
MKQKLLFIAVLGLLAPPLAAAQGWRAPFGPLLQAQGPMKKGEPGGGRDFRGGRDGRPPQRDDRHQGRMTDEERRGLHQDLDRANRGLLSTLRGLDGSNWAGDALAMPPVDLG